MMKVALFDLDHTLIPLDSDHSWGQFVADMGWTDPQEQKKKNDHYYAQYQAGTLDIHEYIRFSTTPIRLKGRDQSLEARSRFMAQVIEPNLFPQARKLVGKYLELGYEVVIVTATNEFITRPIADAFGVKHLIAVDLALNDDGWYTGEIKGTPSFREGKVVRVHDWLTQRGCEWSTVETVFYSDSINDLPLLEKVLKPVATNPDDRLTKIALEKQWEILELFE